MHIHMEKCVKKDHGDIGQLLLSQGQGSMLMRSTKFDPEKFRELAVEAILKHDLPFRFVQYEGIRAMFKYAYDNIKMPSRNTAKSDVLKMYKRKKNKLKIVLGSLPGRICETPENPCFLRKDKMVISVKIWNFSRSRMTKRTSPLESSREI